MPAGEDPRSRVVFDHPRFLNACTSTYSSCTNIRGQGSSPRRQLHSVSSLERAPLNVWYLLSQGGDFQ